MGGPASPSGLNGIDSEPVRRSGRVRKPISYKEIETVTVPQPPPPKRQRCQESAASKADANATNGVNGHAKIPDGTATDALYEVYATLSSDEAKSFLGWEELESEPAHFNFILNELGVSGVRFNEVFSMDEGSSELLVHPVYGLIFLFDMDDAYNEVSEDREPTPQNVWFANQTAKNNCASVALLNILMNAKGVPLGTNLQKFKHKTDNLIPPYRGDRLSRNIFIRTAHNSFARRMELLCDDLSIQNDVDDSRKKRYVKSKSRKKTPKKKKLDNDYAKHYVAYVPINGEIWEMDGLEKEALSLGPYEGDWAATALPLIQAKAMDMGFNITLMALCHSPVLDLRSQLAKNTSHIAALQDAVSSREDNPAMPWPKNGVTDEAALAELGLAESDIHTSEVDEGFRTSISGQNLTSETATQIANGLDSERNRLRADYRVEAGMLRDDIAVGHGRSKDFSAFAHALLDALARKGKLEMFTPGGEK